VNWQHRNREAGGRRGEHATRRMWREERSQHRRRKLKKWKEASVVGEEMDGWKGGRV